MDDAQFDEQLSERAQRALRRANRDAAMVPTDRPTAANQPAFLQRSMAPGYLPESLTYILEEVFRMLPDSILHRALDHHGYHSFMDLIAMPEEDISSLTYPVFQPADEQGDPQPPLEKPVPKPILAYLRGLQGYMYYRGAELNDPINHHNCMEIDHDEFSSYRCSANFYTFTRRSVPTPLVAKPKGRTPAEEFSRSIKLDPSYFPTLKDDKQWDRYQRDLEALCRAHGLLHILDPDYSPVGPDATALFDRHQSFMYHIFVSTLLTDTGKKLVRDYQKTYDAQRIYAKLVEHATTSVTADTNAATIMAYLTTAVLDSTWRGTHESFIMHWLDQVRQLSDLDPKHTMPDYQKRTLLENAVRLQPHLLQVKNTSALLASQTRKPLDFETYVNLLLAAAQTHDAQHSSLPRSRTRKVYQTELDYIEDSHLDNQPELSFDIDTDIGEYQVFQSRLASAPRPRLPPSKWDQLDDSARRAWTQLPDSAKRVILGLSSSSAGAPAPARPPPAPHPSRPASRQANLHEVSAADFLAHFSDLSMGSDYGTQDLESEPPPSANPILANVTKQTSMKPGELQRVMSNKLAKTPQNLKKQEAKKHELVIDGVTYKACATNIKYTVKQANLRKDFALVDRGANGGIAGEDVRIITKTTRSVDVQGLDSHQVNNIPIVTCCAITETNRGPAILVLNQYAALGKGQSILSCAQMEHFKIEVDDKSSKVGGTQRITTPDGYIIPLRIKNGLPYVQMRPPTDRELSNPDIPHVVLTSDEDWDPCVLDSAIDDTREWATTVPDDPPDEASRPFDRFGNLKCNQSVVKLHDSALDDALDYFESFNCSLPINGFYEVYSRPSTSPSWFDANMAQLVDPVLSSHDPDSGIPLQYEVYDARRRPPALLTTGPPADFDVEAMIPARDPPDPSSKPASEPKERRYPRRTRSQTRSVPDPPKRVRFAHDDQPPTNDRYRNPSSAVKSRERDWERLRRHFAWLPKLVVQKTFDCTTQLARIPMSVHLQRHFRSPFPALNVSRRNEALATDTVYSDVPDIEHGHVAAQFFVGLESLVSDVYGVKTDKQFLQTLQDVVRRRGAPNKLVSDSAKAEISQAVKDYLRWLVIDDWQSEPHRQHQNPAERRYQDIKRLTNRLLDRTGAPPECWLLALSYASFVYNHTAVKSLNWRTPIEMLTGTTPDISVLLRFQFYEQVYYKTEEPSFPSESPESLGRLVGIAQHVGHALTYKVLTSDTNKVICRSEIRTADSPNDRNKRLDPPDGETSEPPLIVKSKLDSLSPIDGASGSGEPTVLSDVEDLLGRTFLLEPNKEGHVQRARIVELIDEHEYKANKDPELLKFRVKIGNDEKVEEVMAYNKILERLEADEENPIVWKYKRIISHEGPLRPDDPSYKGSAYNVLIEWENGEITPEPLGIIGADDPVACAIYARDNNLLDTPGWKRFKTIAKRQKKLLRMVNQAKLRSFRTAPKYMYGFEIPKDYQDALRLDRLNGNTRWQDATKVEMDQLAEYKVFIDMGLGTPIPKGFQRIRVHLVYACKHDGRHKARLVADGHLTDIPVDSVYSGAVSLRGLKMMIFLAELNGLELWATDIGNAYLEAYTKEKVAIIAGPEFGPELEGHTLIVSRALYGLRLSGKMWHQRLAECLENEGFKPCKAEPDIWLRSSPDGKSYEYIGVYVDDLAMAMKDPKTFANVLIEKYKFKLKGTGELEFHLGCDFYRDEFGVLCMHPRKYIARMVESFERMFGHKPRTNVTSPLEKGDHPECDTSPLLEQQGVTNYQSLVGQLQWVITLGRMDIATAIMSMSSFRSAPRKGHLDRIKRICGYLYKMKEACLRFRTGLPDYSDLVVPDYDWSESVYGNPVEIIPDDAPEPLGLPVILTHYVDANLYHDMMTGRSVTGIIHMLNGTPFDYFSKKQSTVETATYGSEFVAARTCVEQIMDIRTTLRYLGVPIHDRSYMFGDNESVVNSSSRPDAKLHKRHTALSFHRVREAIASGMLAFMHIDGQKNPADIMSKHWGYTQVWPQLRTLLFRRGETAEEE